MRLRLILLGCRVVSPLSLLLEGAVAISAVFARDENAQYHCAKNANRTANKFCRDDDFPHLEAVRRRLLL